MLYSCANSKKKKEQERERKRDKEHAHKKTNQPWTHDVKKKQAIWTDLQPDQKLWDFCQRCLDLKEQKAVSPKSAFL